MRAGMLRVRLKDRGLLDPSGKLIRVKEEELVPRSQGAATFCTS